MSKPLSDHMIRVLQKRKEEKRMDKSTKLISEETYEIKYGDVS